jgi:hypothetical protein
MTYVEQWNAYCAYKAQSGKGSQASGAGGKVLRQTGGTGGRLSKATIGSRELRRDGMSTRGRHGTQRTNGGWDGELSLQSYDDVMEAVQRGTWGAADLAITQAAMTSVTTTTSTIVAAGGSWITQGLRVGDVIRCTGFTDAANNSKNLRITGLTATTITVAETLVANAVADTSFTVTRPGRVLVNPGAGNLVKRYFTIEEYEYDIDGSEVFTDSVFGSFRLQMQPNGLIQISTSFVGTGQFQTLTGASAPLLTSPTTTTSLPLSVSEAVVRTGGADLIDLTSFDLTVDIQPSAPDVISANKYSPDVFNGSQMVSMNLTVLRSDLQKVSDFLAETQYSLHLLMCENEAEPRDFISVFVPNFTLGSVDKSALAKEGGPRTQTISIPADLVGVDNTGAGYDATMVKIQVSNAT